MQKALDFARAHIQEPLNLSRLAGHVGITARHLSRLFVLHTGATPAVIVRGARMGEAERLLATDPGLSVKEVAGRVGYCGRSPSHFVKEFRAWSGVSPTRYRERALAVARVAASQP